VVPVAIDELRDGQRLSVFARARWMFRSVVWISALLLLVTGGVSVHRNTYAYFGDEVKLIRGEATTAASEAAIRRVRLSHPGWWAAAHSAAGLVSIFIALMLVSGPKPPVSSRAILWMRLNLLILLVVIFLASTTHFVRQRVLPMRGLGSADSQWPLTAVQERAFRP
jgi:hypothetical protein